MTENIGLKLKYLESQLEILTVLGTSDSKRVFLCKDKRNGKIVVKKYVSPTVRPVYEKLKSISNIHIATVYETAFDDKEGIVVEEFINGHTLREFTRIYGLPDRQNLCRIVCDICSALSQTHCLGIIHRDINPDNIMISNDGVLKIIDFGIARMLKERSPQDTALLGTAEYAPPEQFGFSQTDIRADIYSIGIVMGELLTGELLPPDSLRERSHSFGRLGRIIRKCIKIDPRQRFQTVQQLQRAVATPQSLQAFTQNRQTKNSSGITISWLPGFRTGKTWKNVIAMWGYLFLTLCTYIMMTDENYASSAETFLLELLAVFLYLWVSTLLAFNIGNWGQKIFPFYKLPHSFMISFRIVLWFILFYAGASLESYVKYTMMGLTPNN